MVPETNLLLYHREHDKLYTCWVRTGFYFQEDQEQLGGRTFPGVCH